MTTQSEAVLEEKLIEQLEGLSYTRVKIPDEEALVSNLKSQLEKHNKTTFSEKEFKQILNQITKGNILEKAKTLRSKLEYVKDNGDTGFMELINQIHWCQNEYQVANQITIKGKYENRYDVTILVNGLPLVQIELKKRGLELKEAFNQTNRYQAHSYATGKGLFQFVQLFVISNGVNTKYYANNPIKLRSFKQTFFWADEKNNKITNLTEFTEIFLEPCHLSKMITKYIVINTHGVLMVLRPYQYYATEAIVERVKTTNKFGYIWHTTGSGKTLTSFKTSQILTNLPEVSKVVFVVDRKDLDYQTIKEFNSFKEGSVDATNNTKSLIIQFNDETKLIVTTLQKLNNAIWSERYKAQMNSQKEEKIVFIFDECHRTQFGDTHKRIKAFFTNAQMFGFTGTPILKENATRNALGKRTTKDLFEECLHKYVITDAIRDHNVLKFSIDYVQTFKSKENIEEAAVEKIDEQEVLESDTNLNNIADYIITHHDTKTHNKKFTAMMCVSSKEVLIRYYELFKKKKEEGLHNLKIATIYSYGANEDDEDAGEGYYNGQEEFAANEDPMEYNSTHSRDKLEEFIGDYNKMFQTNHNTNNFYQYYKDIAKKVKNQEIDILLVVNMFLTGFDSKTLNTIYVDKNLQYHGLIQAFSRTNRILDELKSQGNVVCFRNLKDKTDEAIMLFSNKEAIEDIILQPYENYVAAFNAALEELYKMTPTVESVDSLPSETEQMAFVKAFRNLIRIKNVLGSFTQFNFEDVDITEQQLEGFQSKYLDIRDEVKSNREAQKTSILNDIDFEVELIRRDEINVAYILSLLADVYDAESTSTKEQKEKKLKGIRDILTNQVDLRSKKELIEKFIEKHLPKLKRKDDIDAAFNKFLDAEKIEAIQKLSQEEDLNPSKLNDIIEQYLFTQKTPLSNDVIAAMNARPKLKDRKTRTENVIAKIKDFVETYIYGVN